MKLFLRYFDHVLVKIGHLGEFYRKVLLLTRLITPVPNGVGHVRYLSRSMGNRQNPPWTESPLLNDTGRQNPPCELEH